VLSVGDYEIAGASVNALNTSPGEYDRKVET